MHFYKTFNSATDDKPHFDSTLQEAKQTVASYTETDRHLVRVELVDIDTDKHTLCIVLNGGEYHATVLRTWAVTPRGGLKEVTGGE